MSDDAMTGIQAVKLPAAPKVREWARKRGVSEWLAARIARLSPRPGATLDALLRKPPQYIRANPLRGTASDTRKRLESRGFEFRFMDLDKNIMRVEHAPISVGATQEHLLGFTTPQDLASASAPLALEAKPRDVVVDMASAPGVKALHVAGDMNDRGALVCTDPDPARFRALSFNFERCGVTSGILHERTGQDLATLHDEPWADRIMLDAPCTGEGTMPKDSKRRRANIEDIGKLSGLQLELMDAADKMLRPGGTMVYATCTFGPEENEAVVQRLLDRGYQIQTLPFNSVGGVPLAPGVTEWPGLELDASLAKCARFYPGIHPTLGFFVAKLRKPTRGDGA